MRGEPGLIEIDAVFVTQRKSKESQEKKAKKRKPKTHPHKPRAGHPPCGCVSCLPKQFALADRLCERKESKSRPGHPSYMHSNQKNRFRRSRTFRAAW